MTTTSKLQLRPQPTTKLFLDQSPHQFLRASRTSSHLLRVVVDGLSQPIAQTQHEFKTKYCAALPALDSFIYIQQIHVKMLISMGKRKKTEYTKNSRKKKSLNQGSGRSANWERTTYCLFIHVFVCVFICSVSIFVELLFQRELGIS